MSLFEKIRIVIKEEDAKDPKKSKAQNYSDKINKKNKNRKEFKFDPKTKERQTFRGKITSGPRKGEGYTIFRRDGGDVKKGVDKGVLPKAAKGSPIDVKSPAHKDLFKRYNKGEPKATQFMIDLGKDDRKARGLGKRAERVKDASGGKKTGSLRKGNLSFPGDRTGAYSRTKSEIEFNKALKKARGNTEGDLPKETPQNVRDYAKKVRDKRIKKLKLPDTSFDSKTKFSQKQFDKSIGGAKKPTSPAAPGLFGKGDTKGQMNVKGMERRAFKITKPSDIKLPKSFRDFQRNLQDYKDRDVPGGPKKYKQTELKFSSKKTTKPSGSRFDPDIGMAPPDKPKTKVVKQSEVSKKAKDFTKNINQTRNKKSFSNFAKQAETAKDKLRKDVDKIAKNPNLTGKQKATQSRPVMKNVKIAQDFERGYKSPNTSKTAKSVVRTSDLKMVKSNTPKIKTPTRVGQKGFVRKPNKISQGNLFNVRSGSDLMKDFVKNNNINAPDPEADQLRKNIERRKELRKLSNKMGQDQLLKAISRTKIGKKIASTKAGKLAIKGTSAIAKSAVKNPYTAAATVVGAGLLTQPNVRKGIKAALTGGGIGALTGAFAKDNRKNKPAEYGKKTYLKKGSISLSPPAPKETNYSKTMSSVKPYDFSKIDKKIKADQTAKKNALSASQKQKQRRGIA